MSHSNLEISRRYYSAPEILWKALEEGYLLYFTGAIKDKSKIDFKVHGKIHIEWSPESCGGSMDGEFIEIIPLKKNVFSWNTPETLNSKVTISIFPQQNYCDLNLQHIFQTNLDTKEYDWGWDDAMFDLKKYLYRDSINN